MELVLYYAPSACSIAPQIALEETGVPYEGRPIDLATNDQRSPDYLKVNPQGRVPALIVDGRLVTEVPALLAFIAGLKPDAALVPPVGTLDHARCFEWLGFLSSSVHVTYAQFRRPIRFLDEGSPCWDELSEVGKQRTIELYRKVEERISSTWAAGESYSIADMYLLPFYTWAWRLDLDVASEFPKWTRIVEALKERPAVQRAMADHRQS